MDGIATRFDAIAKTPTLSVYERLQLQKWHVAMTTSKLNKEVYWGKTRRAQVLSDYHKKSFVNVYLKDGLTLTSLNDEEAAILLKKVAVFEMVQRYSTDTSVSKDQQDILKGWLADPVKNQLTWDSLLEVEESELSDGVLNIVESSEFSANLFAVAPTGGIVNPQRSTRNDFTAAAELAVGHPISRARAPSL